MTLHWPQVVILTMYVLNLGVAMATHGKPRTGSNCFWTSLVVTVGLLAVLFAGGFFGGMER